MPRRHTSSSSASSSYNSVNSVSSAHTSGTDVTTYTDRDFTVKPTSDAKQAAQPVVDAATPFVLDVSPRASTETYTSTVAGDSEDDEDTKPTGPRPRQRRHVYKPDAMPATSHEFASLYPSHRRLLIQHDDSTLDGNMNLRVDVEVATRNRRPQKITLFHLRMKDLAEREFSLRRFGRESGREVASSKKKYIKSVSSTPSASRPSSLRSKRSASSTLSTTSKPTPRRQDSGYESDDEDDESERRFQEVLNVMTAPKEDVVSQPTNSIQLEFSNYAHVTVERKRLPGTRQYEFEYWGDLYRWQRERHIDDGELVYSYDLVNVSNKKKIAIIMPDALSAQEEAWESRQGGWVPASSMRLLQTDISDDLADVIMATGLISITDDAVRHTFGSGDHRR